MAFGVGSLGKSANKKRGAHDAPAPAHVGKRSRRLFIVCDTEFYRNREVIMSELQVGDGMYDLVRKQGESIDDHDTRIVTLEEMTLALKEADKHHEEKLKQMETQNIRLENTVMTTGRETQETMRAQTNRLFEVVERSIDYQTSSSQQAHELKIAKLNAYTNVGLKIAGALTAGGGVVYGLFQWIGN